MAKGHYLVLGGARSGKSKIAESLALNLSSSPAYIATAEPRDHEMKLRVEKHQQSRDPRFLTLEEPLALSKTILDLSQTHRVILVDCLTLWLSNISFDQNTSKEAAMDELATTLKNLKNCQVVFVSNEVGQGIVPNNPLARTFIDDAGLLHQRLAQICENVIMVVAGQPLAFKGQLPNLN